MHNPYQQEGTLFKIVDSAPSFNNGELFFTMDNNGEPCADEIKGGGSCAIDEIEV